MYQDLQVDRDKFYNSDYPEDSEFYANKVIGLKTTQLVQWKEIIGWRNKIHISKTTTKTVKQRKELRRVLYKGIKKREDYKKHSVESRANVSYHENHPKW